MDFNGKTILFVDIESYFDSKKKYGLKEMSVTEYVRDSRFQTHGLAYNGGSGTHWISGDHVISAWVSAVDWANTVVVAHNVKFDGAVLAWRFGVKPYAWFDTLALAKAVLGEQVSGYSLGALADYLGLPSKGELTCDGILSPSAEQLHALGEYCKNDAELCKGIYEKLSPQFPKGQIFHVDWTVRAFVEPRLVLNLGALEIGVQAEKKRREYAVSESGIERDILSSNLRFAEHLASVGVSVPTKTSVRTGKQIPAFAKTDAGLEALRTSHPKLYAARLAAKSSLLETRGVSLLAVGKTGSFPFDVGFSGAVQTHRYSGGSGAGGNPQNFTRNSFLRSSVGVCEGEQLVVGDFAAIELRILSWLAKEPKLINKLVNGEDIYSDFSSLFYKRPITKADKIERQFGKCAILGLGYGMGWEKFSTTVKQQTGIVLSEKEARDTVALYRTTYFNVPRLWEQATRMIPLIMDGQIRSLFFAPFIKVEKNALILPSGLRVQYPNLRWVGDEMVYDVYHKKYTPEQARLYGGKLIENICQGLAGELCKLAIERSEGAGLSCVGQVHDEILAVTPDAEKKRSLATLISAMETAPRWWPEIRLKSEVGYAKNWAEAKK